MNKLFTKIAALCLGATMAVGVGVAVASGSNAKAAEAAQEVYKTISFLKANTSNSVSNYTSSLTYSASGFSVNTQNFNNNQKGWDYIKCGPKKASGQSQNVSTGTITTSAAIDEPITKVVVNVSNYLTNSGSSTTTKLEISSDSSFTNPTEVTTTMASGDLTYTIGSPAANMFYRVSFTVTNKSTTNGLVFVTKVDYYHDNSPAATLTDLRISAGESSVKKSYAAGENFDPTGLTIQAQWDNTWDTANNVVADVVWTPQPLTAGTTSVTGTYSAGGVNKTVTISGITVVSPDFTHTYDSNSVFGSTSSDTTQSVTYTPSDGPEYVTLGGYNWTGGPAMSLPKFNGAYLGNNEEYTINSVKKNISRIEITTNADVSSVVTMTEGSTALSESTTVSSTTSGTTLTYVFSGDNPFFKFKTSGSAYVNMSSIKVYLGSNATTAEVDTVSASIKSGTYYTGNTLLASDFNVTVTWTGGKADTNPTSGFTWTVNGVANGTLSEGNNAVIVTYEGVSSSSFNVVGTSIHATSIEIDTSASVYTGKTVQLTATVLPAGYVDTISWSSNATNIATVNNEGVVTGVAAGSATITATVNGHSDTCAVTVTDAPLEYEIVFGTAEGTTGITNFSNNTIVCPSEVTLDNIVGNVYGSTTNAQVALRFGKSGTTGSFDATISGDYYITSVKCNLKYYGSDTTATFAVTPDGGSSISKSLTGDWADYTYDVSATKAKTVTLGTNVNGKRAFLSGFTISYAVLKTLSNISLSGTYPTSFTKGDSFSHSGMVVTANYSDTTSADVSSSATWSSPDMSTLGAKTITVSYSDEYGSASQTYSITVNYANPTGITLSQNTKRLALLEEFDVGNVEVTINPSGTANQSEYEWVVYDSDGLVNNDTYVFSDGVFYAMEPADAVILRCQSTKAGYAATVYADVTVEITGNPIVTLFNANDQDKTNGSESVFTDAGDITYHVATENFSGTITYTWSSSDDSIISIDSDNGSSCDFYVEGDEGSARLSCRVRDTASHDVTVYIDVTVEDWSVTSVTWTAPTIDVFSGATLTTSDISSWNVKYSTDSGKTNQTAPVGEITVKVNGAAVSLPHTWIAANDGKTLCVEYKGVSSSTTTVAVTQSIHSVMAPVPGDSSTSTLTFTAACGGSGTADDSKAWTVTSDGTESSFDSQNGKGIHYGTGSAAVQYIKLTSTAFTSGKITKVEVNASTASGVSATVSVTVGGNAFGGDPQSLTSSAVPDNPYTFTGDVDADTIEVLITKPESAVKALYCKSIAVTYATDSGEDVEIANVAEHKAAQRAAVAFANAFNAAMDETENCTEGLDDAWSTCSSAYTSFKSAAAALGETEEAYAKNLIKYATAQYSDDSGEACIERMMKTYEVCVQKHGKTAFMDDLVTLGRAPSINPVLANLSGANNTTITIAIVISLVSVTAIGGYFFLRKRKENI